jgi:hypothetical protein
MRSEYGREARRPQVRILHSDQTLGVINLRLRGSKLSIGYGVMEHRETEYERGYGNLPQRGLSRKRQKWDSGLWFESILVNKPSFFLVCRGRGLLRRKSNNRLIRDRQGTGSLYEGRSFFQSARFEFFIITNQLN